MKNLQKIFKAYKKAQREHDELDALVMAGHEELEGMWDDAYETYWNLREALIAGMIELLKVDRNVASKMLATDKFERVMSMKIE